MNRRPDIIVAGVDNQLPETRLFVCRAGVALGIPTVIMGATPDADAGYVHVYEPGSACWACIFRPEQATPAPDEDRCPESAASVDILKVLGGIALYAIDSVLMERPREWNYWAVSLRRAGFGGSELVPRRADCPVCGGGAGR